MAGRRARTGRGWDAAPRRPVGDGADRRTGGGGGGQWWADGSPVLDHPGPPALATPGSADDTGARAGLSAGAGRAGGSRTRARRAGVAAQESASPEERAREICLRQLAVRPRTRAELATALQRRGIEPAVVATVLDRYGEVGIIDDAAFARAWVTSRHHGRGLARRALADELRRKGVDADSMGSALDELDPDTEAETARALVDRKLRTDRGGPPDAVFRRLVGMLARKGYPAGLATRVVKEALVERAEAARDALTEAALDADTTLDAITIDADPLADDPLDT